MKLISCSILILAFSFASNFALAQEEDGIVPVALPLAPFGAKVYGYNMVPTGAHTSAEFGTEKWDVGNFFDPIDPFAVQIPFRKDFEGRYEIHVGIRWYNPPGPLLTNSYFYTYLKVNGVNLGNDARATKKMVGGASGTTQYFSVEADLDPGDIVELYLWQDFGVDVNADVYLTVTLRPR